MQSLEKAKLLRSIVYRSSEAGLSLHIKAKANGNDQILILRGDVSFEDWEKRHSVFVDGIPVKARGKLLLIYHALHNINYNELQAVEDEHKKVWTSIMHFRNNQWYYNSAIVTVSPSLQEPPAKKLKTPNYTAGSSSNVPPTASGSRISITTYNLLMKGYEEPGMAPWNNRKEHVARTLNKNSDILCLQETNMEMLAYLQKQLPENYLYEYVSYNQYELHSIVAFDSNRFKLIKKANIEDMPSRLLITWLRDNNKTVCIASVHPKAGETSEGERRRLRQFENLVSIMDTTPADYYVICGDFNSDPKFHQKYKYNTSRVHEFLTQKGFVNASGTRPTYHWYFTATFDYVYVKAMTDVIVEQVNVNDIKSSAIPDISKGEGSDHTSVTVRLLLQ